MSIREIIEQRLARPLSFYPHLSIEFQDDSSFITLMDNLNPNTQGNYTGGDMAYIANAAAVIQCAAEGLFVQSASINVECIANGEADILVAKCQLVHKGKKLIRARSDVYARKNGVDTLVAIGQINVSLMSDQAKAKKVINKEEVEA